MPKLIKFDGGQAAYAEDGFCVAEDGEEFPEASNCGVLMSLTRFQAEGQSLLDQGRPVGVRLKSDDSLEAISRDLPRLALVALEFPKFRDGRAFSAATLLRERYNFTGEIRAVGDVLREQANYMVRCGFDAFEFSDNTLPEDLQRAVLRFRHVYQTAADRREPAFVERQEG